MKVHDDMTTALQHILLCWLRGYTSWASFEIAVEKVDAKGIELADTFGTRLPSWKRQDHKEAGRPTAVASCVRVVGNPAKREIIVMATPLVHSAPPNSPWPRERWLDRLPEVGSFVMVKEPRERGDAAWTWRLQESVYQHLSGELTRAVKRGDASGIAIRCQTWVKILPMTGGVRRQLRRLFKSAGKLWVACHGSPWPGLSPELLPRQVGFRKTSTSGPTSMTAIAQP